MQNPSSSNKRNIVGGRHLWRDRSGVVAIIVALISPVIFGAAALAVDVGRLVFLESQLQTAADAAALAAATSFNDAATAQSLAQEYAGKNMPSSEFGTVVQTSDVVLGNYDQIDRYVHSEWNADQRGPGDRQPDRGQRQSGEHVLCTTHRH